MVGTTSSQYLIQNSENKNSQKTERIFRGEYLNVKIDFHY